MCALLRPGSSIDFYSRPLRGPNDAIAPQPPASFHFRRDPSFISRFHLALCCGFPVTSAGRETRPVDDGRTLKTTMVLPGQRPDRHWLSMCEGTLGFLALLDVASRARHTFQGRWPVAATSGLPQHWQPPPHPRCMQVVRQAGTDHTRHRIRPARQRDSSALIHTQRQKDGPSHPPPDASQRPPTGVGLKGSSWRGSSPASPP